MDAIEPAPGPAPSERGGDLDRPDLDPVVSGVGRELDRLRGPDRAEVAREEVVRVHEGLPAWRRAQPLRERVEAITQILLAGEPGSLRGGGPTPAGLPGTSPRGETGTRVVFVEGSQELSDAARAEIDNLAAEAVRRGVESARAQLPLPVVEVTGRGNGSRLPGRDREQTARATGRARAAVVADVFRAAIERHVSGLPRDVARHVGPKLFTVNERSVGRDPEAATADQGRTADVGLRDPGQVVLGQESGGAALVPRTVHAVWFGGELGAAARENLLAWRDRAADAGWQVVLWGDAGALNANAGFINDLTASGGASFASVDRGVFPSDGSDAATGDRAHALMNWALGKGGYAMASDIARYGILHRDGGVYVDVDIHPGEVTLPSEGLTAHAGGLPFLAPQLRDSDQFQHVLSDLNRERAAEGLPPLRADDASAMPAVVERQYAEGQFNNNFIVTPAGSSFMRGLLTGLRDPGDPSLLMRDVHQDAAELTGPNYIRRAITSSLEESGNWPVGARWAHQFRSWQVRFAPESQQRWAGLGWLTAESDAQEGAAAAPAGSPSASEQTVLPPVAEASQTTSTVPGPSSAQGPNRPGARGVVSDVDAIEPVSGPAPSEGGSSFGRPDLELVVSGVGRELDRLRGPDRAEVARDEVVRVHEGLPAWRRAQPLRARVEAVTQILLAGEPAGLRGGGPMPASHGYPNAEELLGDLRESARVPDVRRAPGERTLGPNLFGGLDAPQPGPHVGSSTGLGPDGVVPFLDGADMVPGRPESSGELRSSHQGMPQVVHAIWLGGPLRSDGPTSGFWRRFGDAGQRHGREALFTLWTDLPRGLVEEAAASGGRSSD
ncbi:glycosyltransferase, partial [Streptomyces xiaopingdaonensis]|uniref:glycosyltransferase n=1 Tax=Streptomyces xiaopingdaonensis TaxID=1565415 RepID=UPI00192CC198